MISKADKRKAELREKLILAAEKRIESSGLAALRARDLASEVGCAVGAIYNVFDDLNALVLAVNGRTFKKLGLAVSQSLEGAEGKPPVERLIKMSNAYLGFAGDNYLRWRALFDNDMTAGGVPDWYAQELEQLFANIAKPVAELFPELKGRETDLMVRALFSAIHGIVILGLQNRISGVARENIERMIQQVLSRIGN
ncbi:MAG: TetR/AcrR family transcriptional regulator [Albidovulum sp.]